MAKVSMSEQAYEIIRQRITDFDLFPGQTVSDYLLSKDLNMSRTPIRQALQQLESDGLLEKAETGTATYQVAPITAEEIQDLFDFREGIETTAFRLAWKNGIEKRQVQSLQQLIDIMVETKAKGQLKEHFLYDQQFHNALVSISNNKRLIKAHNELLVQLTHMRFLSFLDQSLQDKACFDHGEILDAIRQRDYEKGLAAVAGHIRTSCEDYIKILNKGVSPNLLNMMRLFAKSGNNTSN